MPHPVKRQRLISEFTAPWTALLECLASEAQHRVIIASSEKWEREALFANFTRLWSQSRVAFVIVVINDGETAGFEE